MKKEALDKLSWLRKKLELAKRNNNSPAILRARAQIEILEELTGDNTPDVAPVAKKKVKESPTAQKGSTEVDLGSLTVAELTDTVSSIDDADVLEALLTKETRVTGKQAIKDRIEELN